MIGEGISERTMLVDNQDMKDVEMFKIIYCNLVTKQV